MLLASTSVVLSTAFAAVAALGALGALVQTGRNHRAEMADRASERRERRAEFERETAERRRTLAEERRVRQLKQLARISDQLAIVRQTARAEAAENGSINAPLGSGATQREPARFFWNARSQLAATLAGYRALGGTEPLTACQEVATGSTMNHLSSVVGRCTAAFEELVRANEALAREPNE